MDGDGQPRWVSQAEAARELGCCVRTLARLRQAGVLRRGLHWHRVGLGARSPVRVNVTAARLVLLIASR
jgi:hypothetical protein